MLFLVIFGSLAAAMAIVSQGNLATADNQLKIDRSLAAAETGVQFVHYYLDRAARQVTTRDGLITTDNAPALWTQVRSELSTMLDEETGGTPTSLDGGGLEIGPVRVGPNAPEFTATLMPHPIADEDYTSDYYQRPPFDELNLDARWVRLRVTAHDGAEGHRVTRSVAIDYRINKRIPYAILSKNRVMIGRNVMVDGPIGSSFMDTHLEHGHPIQMESDFANLNDDLDDDLKYLHGTLIENDANGDNRINLANASETDGLDEGDFADDLNGDGYLDEFDYFLKHFDSDGDGRVELSEMESNADDDAEQTALDLFELIDTFNRDRNRNGEEGDNVDQDEYGYNDGFIDSLDRYMKIRGEVHISSDMQTWEEGAAAINSPYDDPAYQDYFAGPIESHQEDNPVKFEDDQNNTYEFGPEDFDVSVFYSRVQGNADVIGQAVNPIGQVREATPYGSPHPYDYYDRPVFEDETFEDVLIPMGTNAVFRNCTFKGVTFVETFATDPDGDSDFAKNFNYAGMEESDGTIKFPDRSVNLTGEGEVYDTKDFSNNIRFESCTFQGAVVTGDENGQAPLAYTHVRNKLAFTGDTQFNLDGVTDADDKQFYQRSTIMAPHYSVELGTFGSPHDGTQNVVLSGTIVAGVLDMRGNIRVNGTILTTFRPESEEGPVIGDTGPQFNTTIGYFDAATGDFEASRPEDGLGLIQLRYDPTLPLPDGVRGPIGLEPDWRTYTEGGA